MTKTFSVAQIDTETGAVRSIAWGSTFASRQAAEALAAEWNDARSEDCGFRYEAVDVTPGAPTSR